MKRVIAAATLLAGCASVEFVPQKPTALDRTSPAAQVDSTAPPLASTMPVLGAATSPPIPVPKEARLSNGIRVLMLEQHAFPLVAIGVTLARGSVDAPPGVFRVFVDSLSSGSELISPKALSRTLYEYAARHSVRVGREASAVEVQFVAPVLGDVVRMIVPTFSSPTFDSSAFTALLDVRKREAAIRRDSPAAVADRELYKLLYPNGHPYAQDDTEGEGVTLETIRSMRSFVGADDVAVVAAGDFVPDKLLPLLEDALRTLKPGATSRKPIEPGMPQPAHVLAMDHPGDSQARIALGFMGVKVDDPDYAALYCLARAVGESSRDTLRLGHGSTYAVSSSIPMMKTPAPLVVTAAVNVSSVGQALRDTFGALTAFEATMRDPVEFQRLKSRILAAWPDTFDTVLDAAHKLETLAQLDLPADTWVKLRDSVQALTADDLSRVAKKYLDPAHAQLVVLGDVSRFRADLDALGVAAVEVRRAH